MRAKLGLARGLPDDARFTSRSLQLLQANATDYTRFFRRLCDFKTDPDASNSHLRDMFIDPPMFDEWAKEYRARLAAENSVDAERGERMRLINPKYILRNHIAQQAIERAETGDYSEVDTLLEVLQHPFDEQPEMVRFAEPPPEGSKRVVVSCSS